MTCLKSIHFCNINGMIEFLVFFTDAFDEMSLKASDYRKKKSFE